MTPTPYLPDELLLLILSYLHSWAPYERQTSLASFCGVSRQWYDVGVQELYDAPVLEGRAYELFVRTVCPSVNVGIKHSPLAELVRVLDLSHIVHQSSRSVTARLLARTKPSLQIFIAPQASFAVNCWASLSKCARLRVLDLTLVSESISFQSLNKTIRQLPDLRELYLPRCSTNYDNNTAVATSMRWPPYLEHLSLSGKIAGQFLWDMLAQPESFPPTLYSIAVLHSPGLEHRGVRPLLCNLASTLTRVELRDLPNVKHGKFNGVLEWLPRLTVLTVALDYIDTQFGFMPANFSPSRWEEAKPLQSLTLVTSGQTSIDPAQSFSAVDLYALIDERFLGRLRYLEIAQSTEWGREEEGAEVEALEMLLVELDKENWEERRWHYENRGYGDPDMSYERWIWETNLGRRMRPRLRMLKNR